MSCVEFCNFLRRDIANFIAWPVYKIEFYRAIRVSRENYFENCIRDIEKLSHVNDHKCIEHVLPFCCPSQVSSWSPVGRAWNRKKDNVEIFAMKIFTNILKPTYIVTTLPYIIYMFYYIFQISLDQIWYDFIINILLVVLSWYYSLHFLLHKIFPPSKNNLDNLLDRHFPLPRLADESRPRF